MDWGDLDPSNWNGMEIGAGLGGLAGSFIPGVGTMMGAGMGGALGGMFDTPNAPQVGTNPYQGDWKALIAQLRARSMGQGGSTAGYAYLQANNQAQQQAAGIARGGDAGAAAAGSRAVGELGSQAASGYGQARAQEMGQAGDALTAALSGASGAWNQQQQLALQQWAIQNGLDMSKLKALSGLLGSLGGMIGKKPPPDPYQATGYSDTEPDAAYTAAPAVPAGG